MRITTITTVRWTCGGYVLLVTVWNTERRREAPVVLSAWSRVPAAARRGAVSVRAVWKVLAAMTLQRRTPLRAKPRSKGNRAEREVIDILKAHGWTGAYRNFMSGGYGGADILNGPAGCSIEVKRQERCSIWSWLEQCEQAAKPTDIPLVVFRRSRSQWYACLPLEELLPLLRMRESA